MKKRLLNLAMSAATASFALALPVGAGLMPVTAHADSYIDMLNQMGGNPAEFNVAAGEKLFKEKRGPNKKSLETCDFGLGPGVLKGAYAQMPRYFADTGKVQDVESRLVTCMETIQGFSKEQIQKDVLKDPFEKNGGNATDIVNLALYVAHQSDGMPMNVAQNTPEEKQSFINGKKFFWYRAGPYNFSCATCHAENDKQIKISKLPNLATPDGEKAWVAATWPAYPDSQGVARTLEWRMNDCMRQQRIAEPKYLSQVVIDLETYMGVMAKGHKILTPSFKR